MKELDLKNNHKKTSKKLTISKNEGWIIPQKLVHWYFESFSSDQKEYSQMKIQELTAHFQAAMKYWRHHFQEKMQLHAFHGWKHL